MAGAEGESDSGSNEDVMAWATAVAQADGGFMGIGSVSSEEERTLAWIESVLGTQPDDGIATLPTRKRASGKPQPMARLSIPSPAPLLS